jgi:hypothetical protein
MTYDASGLLKLLLVQGSLAISCNLSKPWCRALAWKRRLSVLSTSSSIFSPRSSTFSMLSTMMFFTSLTCASRGQAFHTSMRVMMDTKELEAATDTAACEPKRLQAAVCAGTHHTHLLLHRRHLGQLLRV